METLKSFVLGENFTELESDWIEDEKLIDESSLDSYDSSFIDDQPSETTVMESSEEQTDKVRNL